MRNSMPTEGTSMRTEDMCYRGGPHKGQQSACLEWTVLWESEPSRWPTCNFCWSGTGRGPHATVSCWSGLHCTGTSALFFLCFRDASSSDGSLTADAGNVLQIQRGTGERRQYENKLWLLSWDLLYNHPLRCPSFSPHALFLLGRGKASVHSDPDLSIWSDCSSIFLSIFPDICVTVFSHFIP